MHKTNTTLCPFQIYVVICIGYKVIHFTQSIIILFLFDKETKQDIVLANKFINLIGKEEFLDHADNDVKI